MPDENLLLYLNLTGELFYIVIHRMKSQNVKGDLQSKVYNDVGAAIFNPEVIQAFVSGKLKITHYKFPQMKALLDNIVHSSIMSINDYSLEKLFELTLIATKYQFFVCEHPKDILLIALNHVDAIRKYMTDPATIQLARNVHTILVDSYSHQTTGHMRDYLHEIRNYVQEINLKMTNLINQNVQLLNGTFIKDISDFTVHPECSKPGTIEYAFTDPSDRSSLKSCIFDREMKNMPDRGKSSIEFDGDRVIKLGLSLYDVKANARPKIPETYTISEESASSVENEAKITSRIPHKEVSIQKRKAIGGLDLCSTLLGCDVTNRTPDEGGPANTKGYPKLGASNSSVDSAKPNVSGNTEKVKKNVSYGDINVVQLDARHNRGTVSALMKEFDSLDFDPPGHKETLQVDSLDSPIIKIDDLEFWKI